MAVLERRIAAGDSMLKNMPGERRLADEVGVSYMTARKAVQGLLEKKVLTRRANGSLAIRPRTNGRAAVARVVLLTPAYPSTHFIACRLAISQTAQEFNIQFRPVEYVHWHDPAATSARRSRGWRCRTSARFWSSASNGFRGPASRGREP